MIDNVYVAWFCVVFAFASLSIAPFLITSVIQRSFRFIAPISSANEYKSDV